MQEKWINAPHVNRSILFSFPRPPPRKMKEPFIQQMLSFSSGRNRKSKLTIITYHSMMPSQATPLVAPLFVSILSIHNVVVACMHPCKLLFPHHYYSLPNMIILSAVQVFQHLLRPYPLPMIRKRRPFAAPAAIASSPWPRTGASTAPRGARSSDGAPGSASGSGGAIRCGSGGGGSRRFVRGAIVNIA